MKQLPVTFESKGFTHELLERQGDAAIYKRSRIGTELHHFEVIRIKRHNGFKIPGTDLMAEPAEMYPSSTQWGVSGWTFNYLEPARKKFDELAHP